MRRVSTTSSFTVCVCVCDAGAHNITPEVVMGFVQRYEPTAEGKERVSLD